LLLDATADSLPVTPCSFDTIRSRRGNREWTRLRVWVAISVGVKRTGVTKSEKGDWMDTRLHLPWRVEARWDVTASKRLLFYLLVFIWLALSAEFMRKGDGGIEWPGLGFLKLEGTGSVCEGI
jgi:hypothetical protein